MSELEDVEAARRGAEWQRSRDVAELDALTAQLQAAQATIDAVRAIHAPIEAMNYNAGRPPRSVKVCAGCGTDDGNWQIWPCPTIRALAPVTPTENGENTHA